MSEYFTLDDIENETDLNGEKPVFYMICGNRSSGKTTCLLLKSLKLFKSSGKATLFLYRVKEELGAVSELYSDVLKLYSDIYPYTLTTKSVVPNLIKSVIAEDSNGEKNIIAYAVALNDCDKLKKYSPIFSNVELGIFDEFVLENGRYLSDEIQKLQSIIYSVSRGGGKQSRSIPFYLLGNKITLMNPYFTYFGIHKRLRSNTRFIRGDRWIAQFDRNLSAVQAISENPVSKVFKNSTYSQSMVEDIYLYDDKIFITKASGKNNYLFTIVHDSTSFAIREYYEQGIVYVDYTVDPSYEVLTFNTKDHGQNTLMLSTHAYVWDYLNAAYKQGLLRFKDINCKNAIFDVLCIKMF